MMSWVLIVLFSLEGGQLPLTYHYRDRSQCDDAAMRWQERNIHVVCVPALLLDDQDDSVVGNRNGAKANRRKR
jgi:hypothetical protein